MATLAQLFRRPLDTVSFDEASAASRGVPKPGLGTYHNYIISPEGKTERVKDGITHTQHVKQVHGLEMGNAMEAGWTRVSESRGSLFVETALPKFLPKVVDAVKPFVLRAIDEKRDVVVDTGDGHFAVEGADHGWYKTWEKFKVFGESVEGVFSFDACMGGVDEAAVPSLVYHGSKQKISKFTLDKLGTGSGHDQEGPGLYFTSDPKDAAAYANPNGFIYEVWITPRKIVPQTGKVNRKMIERLIRQSPDLDDRLTDWDEDPLRAFRSAVDAVVQRASSPFDALQQVWIDFYKGKERQFLKNVVELTGYDVAVPATAVGRVLATAHVIVFDPDIVKIVSETPYADFVA